MRVSVRACAHELRALRRLIKGLRYAALPVANALFMLLIFTSMYASIGTHVFRERAPEYFATFTTSLFTLAQCLSGDSWASGVTRSIFLQRDPNSDIKGFANTYWSIAIYFVTYYALATVVLLNVVVAVLLDEFITSMREEEEELAAEERQLRELGRYRGVLDPVTASLCAFEDKSHLCNQIDKLYERLDLDGNGGVDFEELQKGMGRLPGGAKVHITRDDFDVITQQGELLGPGGEFDRSQFQDMMLGEMLRYSHRKVMNMLQDTEQEEFRALVLLIRMNELTRSRMERDLAQIMMMQEKLVESRQADMARVVALQGKLVARLGMDDAADAARSRMERDIARIMMMQEKLVSHLGLVDAANTARIPMMQDRPLASTTLKSAPLAFPNEAVVQSALPAKQPSALTPHAEAVPPIAGSPTIDQSPSPLPSPSAIEIQDSCSLPRGPSHRALWRSATLHETQGVGSQEWEVGTAVPPPISISPSLSSGRNWSSWDYPGFGARLQRRRTSPYTTHAAHAFTSEPWRAPEVSQGPPDGMTGTESLGEAQSSRSPTSQALADARQGLLGEVSMELDSECSDDVDAGGLHLEDREVSQRPATQSTT